MTASGVNEKFDSTEEAGSLPILEQEILGKLKQDLAARRNPGESLLAACSKWSLSAEMVDGVYYEYVLAQEAFDLISLMNRLAIDCKGLIPAKDLSDAVFGDEYELVSAGENLRGLLGPVKYNQYLNYFYGVLLEEILIFAIEDEVRKMYTSNGFRNVARETDIALTRLYGASERALLDRYCQESGFDLIEDEMSITQKKEFTYWLFKFRMRSAEPAKAASDVSKALNYLHAARNGSSYRKILEPAKPDGGLASAGH